MNIVHWKVSDTISTQEPFEKNNNLTLVVIAPGYGDLVGVERPLPVESLLLYVVVSTTTSGCTTMDCIEDCTDGAELCQLGGSSVIVVRDGAQGLGAVLLFRDLSPLLLELEVDFRACTGEPFGEGVERRSGCSKGRTCEGNYGQERKENGFENNIIEDLMTTVSRLESSQLSWSVRIELSNRY